LQFLLHSQSHIERDGIDEFEQQISEHAIDLCAGNTLAKWFGVLDPLR
jgi:hypothetical protein